MVVCLFGGLFVSCWSVFLLVFFSVVLLSAFALFGGILCLLVGGRRSFPVRLPVSALSRFFVGGVCCVGSFFGCFFGSSWFCSFASGLCLVSCFWSCWFSVSSLGSGLVVCVVAFPASCFLSCCGSGSGFGSFCVWFWFRFVPFFVSFLVGCFFWFLSCGLVASCFSLAGSFGCSWFSGSGFGFVPCSFVCCVSCLPPCCRFLPSFCFVVVGFLRFWPVPVLSWRGFFVPFVPCCFRPGSFLPLCWCFFSCGCGGSVVVVSLSSLAVLPVPFSRLLSSCPAWPSFRSLLFAASSGVARFGHRFLGISGGIVLSSHALPTSDFFCPAPFRGVIPTCQASLPPTTRPYPKHLRRSRIAKTNPRFSSPQAYPFLTKKSFFFPIYIYTYIYIYPYIYTYPYIIFLVLNSERTTKRSAATAIYFFLPYSYSAFAQNSLVAVEHYNGLAKYAKA